MKAKLLYLLVFAFCLTTQINAAEVLPLAGEWRFALDRDNVGTNENWFAWNLSDKIQLPGILQAQGYGDDISTNTPWVLGLGDAWWKLQPRALRQHFSQSGRVEVPFLAQPPKHYLGAAWYQRDIEIPKDWNGRHFTLFLERVHWKSTVWLDEKEIGSDISLSTPHEFDLGLVAETRSAEHPLRAQSNALRSGIMPGKHRLTIRVDNRLQLPAAGHLEDSHSISDALGATWNGIVGKIELRSTPPVWIEDVRVFPKVETKTVNVRYRIRKLSHENWSGKIHFDVVPRFLSVIQPIAITNATVVLDGDSGDFSTDIYVGSNASFWNEFRPKLYDLNIGFALEDTNLLAILKRDSIFDSSETRLCFGLREIATNDKDILLNGKPINLRMTHFGGDFPLNGYPAMDVESWRKIFQTCKDYGLNGMRFHSWCPPEAAFEAADEMGFYLQPECGLWADFDSPVTRQFLEDETARIIAAYGNHPSFILLSPSNEPGHYQHSTPPWAVTNYALDNRRLYSAGTGWNDPSQVNGGAQFATLVRYGGGQLRNSTAWFGGDFRDALAAVHIPVLAHEVGQWCAYPDFDVMKKFTGYLRPGNYDIFKYIAQQEGVLDEDKEFAWASGRFQLACYKEEIEANLRTPGLAGFQLLDLHDYLGQGTALIGVLDTFWQSKGYVTPEEFRHFCGPVVPLARLTKRVLTTADKFEVPVEIYNFGEHPLTNAITKWAVLDTGGRSAASGEFPAQTIPIGKNSALGKVSLDLAKLPTPRQYCLNVWASPNPNDNSQLVRLKAAQSVPLFQNNWNFWLYPAQVEDSKASDVLVTSAWADAEKRLAAGGKVLFQPTAADLDPAKCPPMKNVPVFWNIQMTVRPPQNPRPKFDAMLGLLCETNSPALAEFPTDKNCDWQWTPLVNNVRSVNLEGAPASLRPIVWAIDDWNRNWKLGVIFECNVGPGRLLVSAINLDGERAGPGLPQLRRSLLDYMGSAKFHPTTTLTPEQVRGLWTGRGSTSTTNEPARVFDPDLNDGSIPAPMQPKR